MKNFVLNFFREFDLFSAPASLRIEKKHTMRSSLLGMLSLALFAGLIYILVTNCLGIIQYEQISSEYQQTIIPGSDASGEIKMFAITYNYLQTNISDKYFDFFMNYYIEGELTQRTKLAPCRPEQWADLGQNYNQTFYDSLFHLMYCPNITTPYKIKQTASEVNSTYLTITLQICNQKQRLNCNTTDAVNYFSKDSISIIWFCFLDAAIHPNNQKIITYKIGRSKIVVGSNFKSEAYLMFSSITVQTDTNILPWENVEVQNTSAYGLSQTNIFFMPSAQIATTEIAKYTFTMLNKMRIYKRSIGKLDQVISYVGGLFSVALPVLAWFLFSYNKYRYEIKVGEGAFNFDEDRKRFLEKNFTFLTYIKYSVYVWINTIFCTKLKWKNCNKIDRIRNSVIAEMDAGRLFRRLHKIEETVNHTIDKNEQACIMLIEPLSLKNLKKERLKLDYYDEVMKGEAAITLEDLFEKQRKIYVQSGQHNHEKMNSAVNLNQILGMESDEPRESKEKQKKIDFANVIAPLSQGYQLVKDTADFVRTKQIAEKTVLSSEFQEVENHLAQVYSQFSDSDKHIIQNRIPMVILHRLNNLQKQPQQKKKQQEIYRIDGVVQEKPDKQEKGE